MSEGNIYQKLPGDLSAEVIETLLEARHIRVERIISHGQSSAEGFWYEQAENEWLIVLQGRGVIRFENRLTELRAGDYLHIPAGQKHRVDSTQADEVTIWLAVFYP